MLYASKDEAQNVDIDPWRRDLACTSVSRASECKSSSLPFTVNMRPSRCVRLALNSDKDLC